MSRVSLPNQLKWLTAIFASGLPESDPLNRYIGERHANIRGHAKLPTVVSGVVPRQVGCIVGEPRGRHCVYQLVRCALRSHSTLRSSPACLPRILHQAFPRPCRYGSAQPAIQQRRGLAMPFGHGSTTGLGAGAAFLTSHCPGLRMTNGRVVVGAPAASQTICT